ncbi:MAG: hypothetical protein ACKN9F_07620 [Methylomonas sp.]
MNYKWYFWLLICLFSGHANAVNLSELIVNRSEPMIIADKSKAMLYVFNPLDSTIASTPALFGKVISDDFNKAWYDNSKPPAPITPAGVFKTRKSFSTHLRTDITAIIEGSRYIVAIHPVYSTVRGKDRVKRLSTLTVFDNRVTNGCINVPENFYYKNLNQLKDGIKVVVLKENDNVYDDISVGQNINDQMNSPYVNRIYN